FGPRAERPCVRPARSLRSGWPASVPAIVGRDTVERDGGRVVVVPLRKGRSTSALIERARRAAR
ncbi:MAG: hypothetical protein ACREF4_10085, partial [Gammaproteobacteria bacterium]